MAIDFRVDQEKINAREILESLRYARLIQEALLPSKQTLNRLLAEHFILLLPKEVVSGDFFWVSQKNRQTCIVAADCTGHGVPGALMSIMGMAFLNEVVRNDNSLMAGRILNKLREKVMETLHQTGEFNESKDGIDLSLCIINEDKTELQFSGANNPLYILRDMKLIEIKADNMPVGVNAIQEEPFTQTNLELRNNDTLYMFSDGFPDQFGGPKGKKFKYRPFKQLLLDIHRKTMEEQHDILKKTIIEWMAGTEQIDDILVMGFKIS